VRSPSKDNCITGGQYQPEVTSLPHARVRSYRDGLPDMGFGA
jgi:hypothetical protein